MTDAINIIRKLQDSGHEAYLVGGCVRDMTLRRENEDYDIATSATPKEVKKVFTKTKFVGENFGVSLVKVNGETYEIATFRADGAYNNGRSPDTVKYTTSLNMDAERRDLTINAMYYDPIKNEVHDPFEGEKDLDAKVIRFVGDAEQRLREDHVRILRAIRFKLVLGFEWDRDTLMVIKDNTWRLQHIKAERFRDEFFKIVRNVKPSVWVEEFKNTGAIDALPELIEMYKTEQDPVWHPEGNVLTHSLMVADYLFDNDKPLTTVLAGLYHDIGKTVTTTEERFGERIKISAKGHAKESARLIREWSDKYKLPTAMREEMAEVAYDHMSLLKWKDMKKSTLKKYLNKKHAETLLDVVEADCTSGTKSVVHSNSGTELKKLKIDYVEKGTCNPPPLLTGKDLIVEGLTPSPAFSIILNRVIDAQLEGSITTKEEALKLALTGLGENK